MQKARIIHWGKFFIRWGVAAVGIWYVISRMSWHDQAMVILPGQTMPRQVSLLSKTQGENDANYDILNPQTGHPQRLPRNDVVNPPDYSKLAITVDGKKEYVVGVDLTPDLKSVRRVLLAPTPSGPSAHWVPPARAPNYHIMVPHPRVQFGVIRMVASARVRLLLLALAVYPVTIIITSLRWQELLKAIDIRLTIARTFVLNMVGLFYNTFMLGSTGGDVLKAYYVARQTHHRTRAVMSVLVDRVIGLLALIILGGVMAAVQWRVHTCREVALASAGILALVALGATIFYMPALHTFVGLDWIIAHLPMQRQVHHIVETLRIYGRRWPLVIGSIVASFPVHMTVVLSALLCGMAFHLPISPFYYWMAVPIIVLVGSIPISPQGAGVMEYFAIKLLEPQGATVGQAFALTMSIRLVQIIWNLTGGIFVFRGGYHAPTASEQQEVERVDEDFPVPEPQTPVVF